MGFQCPTLIAPGAAAVVFPAADAATHTKRTVKIKCCSALPCFACRPAHDLPESGSTAAMQAPAADEARSDLRLT